MAPGVSITSTVPGSPPYGTGSGTSFASPIAAAAAALIIAAPAQAQTPGPVPIAPSAGKALKRGVPFSFKAKLDTASEGSGVFLIVSKSKKVNDDGTLSSQLYFREMKGSGGSYSKKVERYAALSDHFLNRSGKYYWQAYAIDCSDGTEDCNIESEIRSFRIK
jgi:subtilisin family serine protease